MAPPKKSAKTKTTKPKKAVKAKKAAKTKKPTKKTVRKTLIRQNPWMTKVFIEGDSPSDIRTKQKEVEDFYEWLIEKFYNQIPGATQYKILGYPVWTPAGADPQGHRKYTLVINLDPPPEKHGQGAGLSDPPNPTQPPPKLS